MGINGNVLLIADVLLLEWFFRRTGQFDLMKMLLIAERVPAFVTCKLRKTERLLGVNVVAKG